MLSDWKAREAWSGYFCRKTTAKRTGKFDLAHILENTGGNLREGRPPPHQENAKFGSRDMGTEKHPARVGG